jgi:enamine deaminase RidA (YjgF/YER057c/UK114 family)
MKHTAVNPPSLLAPVGFSHAVVAAPGRTVYLGGQTGHRQDGSLPDGLAGQFAQALDNLRTVLVAVRAGTEHLVNLHIFVTDAAAYRTAADELGQLYRAVLGRHYPAMALFEVGGLYDPDAVVELVATAVIPDV